MIFLIPSDSSRMTPARPTSELVVDAARLMALGAQDEEATQRADLLALLLGLGLIAGARLGELLLILGERLLERRQVSRLAVLRL